MHTRVIGAFVFCGRKRQIFWEDIFLEEGKRKRSNGNNLRKNCT